MAAADILVTGGNGFLGRTLRAHLPQAHYLGRADCDLTDGAAVAGMLAARRPEVIVHLAARVGGIVANMAMPADFLLDNLRIDANLCAAVRARPPRHLLLVLSTCMYPDRLDDAAYPMAEGRLEDGPPPPTNAAYAQAKRALWHAARALHQQYQVPYTALVPANLYGPEDHFEGPNSHFLAAALGRLRAARAARADSVTFFGSGVARRQYVFAPDLARLIARLSGSPAANATYNVAPKGDASIAELAAAAAAAVGYRGRLVFDGRGPDGQLRKDVCSARLRRERPDYEQIETPLTRGLQQTVAALDAAQKGSACVP